MICADKDASVSTAKGTKPLHDIRVGDHLVAQSGTAEIKAVRQHVLAAYELKAKPHFRPIMIRAGALGEGLPTADLMVSPNQRIFVSSERSFIGQGEREAWIAAKHLVNNAEIYEVDVTSANYLHLEAARHEAVLINGIWLEAFQPADWSLGGAGNAQRLELRELFPDLYAGAHRAEFDEVSAPVEPRPARKRFLFF